MVNKLSSEESRKLREDIAVAWIVSNLSRYKDPRFLMEEAYRFADECMIARASLHKFEVPSSYEPIGKSKTTSKSYGSMNLSKRVLAVFIAVMFFYGVWKLLQMLWELL